MMQAEKQQYLLELRSASFKLIQRFARRRRLTVGDATLLRAQLALELKQHRLGIRPQAKRQRRAA